MLFHLLLPFILLLLRPPCSSSLALPQVDQEIDDPNDLLAVESNALPIAVVGHPSSSINEVNPSLVAIAPAPPGFGGERLTAAGSPPGAGQGGPAELIEYENVVNPDGSYSFRYATSDGTSRQETGFPNPERGGDGGGHSAAGSFSYVGPDGRAYTVEYSADADGSFRTTGNHLPVAPALPPALQRWEDAKAGRIRGVGIGGGGGGGGVNLRRGRKLAASLAGREESLDPSPFPARRIQFRRPLRDQGARIRCRPSGGSR